MNKKKAFTLAEVLISVSIIGFIAVLTIPSVMYNTNKKTSAVGLKRAISALDQAIDMSRAESRYQPSPKCYYADDGSANVLNQCKELFIYIKDMMQVNKYCDGNAVAGGCMPEYEATGTCEGWNDVANKKAFVTTDGLVYFNYDDYNGAAIIGVDVNGEKGPNKWGFDVFSLSLQGHPGIMQTYKPGGCEVVADGGNTGAELLEEPD